MYLQKQGLDPMKKIKELEERIQALETIVLNSAKLKRGKKANGTTTQINNSSRN
jgi:hypothetical protein|tara:strand:+ start:2209 stop:2370 length:162 start_codon:yes stop_codon:yes gene_type:complete